MAGTPIIHAFFVIANLGLAIAADPPPIPPKAAAATPVDPKAGPPDLADWTPRPATGQAEPWEKMRDPQWDDGRFRLTNTGPTQAATFRYLAGTRYETVYKGLALRLGGTDDAGVLFDRSSLRLVTGWTGSFLVHSDRRFGLLNTPTPAGIYKFGLPPGPGWADPSGNWDAKQAGVTAPLPREWAQFRGHYLHGNRVVLKYTVGDTEVLDAPNYDPKSRAILRTLQVGPRKRQLVFTIPDGAEVTGAVAKPFDRQASIPAGAETVTVTVKLGASDLPIDDLAALTKPGPARWGPPSITKLVRGDASGPFAVDTLILPYENPHKALFFCTGLDFLPDGRIAVCTCHGDVWLATIAEATDTISWQRFATGLYHPLGLKVVDGKVVVLERGQLTRLHDENGDGEADFYECLANDWDTGAGEHAYDTCLEIDPQGNFYFFKTGDTQLPTGGCLLKVAKDGRKVETVATGFRHPIGLGMSPTGIVTGADQEGNWMPATRIDQYKPGGFYGDMRGHHRLVPPVSYDGPLCWLPREVDNSAGGQVWVPEKAFGPLGGLPLHLSYGRCKPFVLLRHEYSGGVQGGAWDLGIRFLAGVCRGRFDPAGHLYVCGLNGWQTAAKADGCVQRVRYTGKPLNVPIKLEVVPDGVNLTFSMPLDKASAEDPARYRAARWNYRWTGDYGSKRYKPSNPNEVGQDDVIISSAKLLADGRTVHVVLPGMAPVMQLQVGMNVTATDGSAVVGSVYMTVHHTGAK